MAAQTLTAPVQRAVRREWIGLAVLALPTLLLSLDMSVLYLALPLLSTDLGASATQQLWIMDNRQFSTALGMNLGGGVVMAGTSCCSASSFSSSRDYRRYERACGWSRSTSRWPSPRCWRRSSLGVFARHTRCQQAWQSPRLDSCS